MDLLPVALASVLVGSLIGAAISIVTLIVQQKARKAERVDEAKRWEAEFYIPREVDALSNVYASLVDLYVSFYRLMLPVSPNLTHLVAEQIQQPKFKEDLKRMVRALHIENPTIGEDGLFEKAKSELTSRIVPEVTSDVFKAGIFIEEENVKVARRETSSAYRAYARCKALAHIYLKPDTLAALDRVDTAYAHMSAGFATYRSPDELKQIRQTINWDELRTPYNDAVTHLKGQLTPSLWTPTAPVS